MGVNTDSTGRSLLTGTIAGEVNFGTGPLVPMGDLNIFVATFSP